MSSVYRSGVSRRDLLTALAATGAVVLPTAHATYAMPIAALREFAAPTQFMFSTDYPIEPTESTVCNLADRHLPAAVEHALDRGNTERLWPKFKTS